jgi:hypothetical protein
MDTSRFHVPFLEYRKLATQHQASASSVRRDLIARIATATTSASNPRTIRAKAIAPIVPRTTVDSSTQSLQSLSPYGVALRARKSAHRR